MYNKSSREIECKSQYVNARTLARALPITLLVVKPKFSPKESFLPKKYKSRQNKINKVQVIYVHLSSN